MGGAHVSRHYLSMRAARSIAIQIAGILFFDNMRIYVALFFLSRCGRHNTGYGCDSDRRMVCIYFNGLHKYFLHIRTQRDL